MYHNDYSNKICGSHRISITNIGIFSLKNLKHFKIVKQKFFHVKRDENYSFDMELPN